jgi:hypothetical protein
MIGKWIRAIGRLIRRIKPDAEKAARVAVKVVDIIYDLAKSPGASFVVGLTKEKWDDAVLAAVLKFLPRITERLRLIQYLADLPIDQMAAGVSRALRDMSVEDRNGERLKMAVALAIELTADGDLSYADAVKLVQVIKDGKD